MTSSNLHLSESPIESRRFLPVMLLLFVGSGCAALIYEIVWLQQLSLVIGASAISLGVLLGTFMGGMCLGSFILPRLIPARLHPLKVYAYLEIGIAFFGLVVLYGLPIATDIYIHQAEHGPMIRAMVAAAFLIPPTLLMGATLPAISRYVQTTSEGVSWMGIFYGGNIAGAVVGCLLAGFYLLRLFDMHTATYAAFALNLVVAALALMVSSRTPHNVVSNEAALPPAPRARGSAMAYLVIAMSGLCALGAEVVWTRLLSLMLGATVYTFSIILAVFLVGLGIGSSWGAMLSRGVERPRLALGWCQILLAGTVAWAAWMINTSLPFWPIDLTQFASKATYSPWITFQVDVLRTAWVVLPGAILWGASFPLALASVASRGQDPGRMVGGVYAANTVGAIGGSLAFSMYVVPQFGTETAQKIIMILCLLSGLFALLKYLLPGNSEEAISADEAIIPPAFSPFTLVLAVIAIVLAGLAAYKITAVPWIAVAWGRQAPTWADTCYLPMAKDADLASLMADPKNDKFDRYCTYIGEGMNVSVAVTQGKSGYKYFHGAGKVQASSDPQDMRLQRMLGHLSVLAHRDPDKVEDVLVVACGAGVTAGSFIPYPHVKNVTICDIERLVPTKVTPQFGDQNYHIVDGIAEQNPKTMPDGKIVEVAYDDGRHFVRTLGDKKYDIITSDPIDPWVKGCAALNTVEYYEMCKAHLKPGGVMSLWIPLYESNEATAKSVIGTFFQVFPNGILFSNDDRGAGYDAVLFGRAEETTINVDEMQERLDRPEYAKVKQSLLDVGFGGQKNFGVVTTGTSGVAVDLLATYAGRAPELGDWMKDAQINTDRNLRLQYLAGMWLNSYMETKILNGVFAHYKFPTALFTGSPERLASLKQALEGNGRPVAAHTTATAPQAAAGQ